MGQKLAALLAMGSLLIVGCEAKKAANFSILADANVYAQDGIYEPRKIDVLWIVDNSGSMQSSQESLAANFSQFIQKFQSLNFDFHIAVAATDSWKTLVGNSNPSIDWSNFSKIRDGFPGFTGVNSTTGDPINEPATRSGQYILTRDTTDIVNTFVTNAKLGIHGTGDERAFQSMEAVLSDSRNSDFRREDAFLAIIILSDEDDFSHNLQSPLFAQFTVPDYTNTSLHTVQRYVDFLNTYTNRTDLNLPANFSVSAIAVTSDTCKNTLNTDGFDRIVGQRYMDLVAATNGTMGSLCSDFANTLANISDSIVNYSSVFPLTRVPIEETIRIYINSELVQKSEVDGWTYRASDNSIWFHGNSVPPSGSSIRIDFDPVGFKN